MPACAHSQAQDPAEDPPRRDTFRQAALLRELKKLRAERAQRVLDSPQPPA